MDRRRHIVHPSDVEFAIEDLGRRVFVIQRLGLMSAIATTLNIVVMFIVLAMTVASGVEGLESGSRLLLILMQMLPMSAALLLLGQYEYRRRRADVLYQELSDELEWHITQRKGRRSMLEQSVDPPPIGLRVVLREYAAGTELPLTPSGRAGPVTYAAVNLIVAALGAVFLAAAPGI